MSTLLKAIVILCSIGFASIPVANAAQGCGWGFHRGYYGQCVPNGMGYARWGYPVVYRPVVYRPYYYHHSCWRNWRGYGYGYCR